MLILFSCLFFYSSARRIPQPKNLFLAAFFVLTDKKGS